MLKKLFKKKLSDLFLHQKLKALGIYEVVEKDWPDHNFYDVGAPSYAYNAGTDTVNEDFTVTPKNVDKLKTDFESQVSKINQEIKEFLERILKK